MVGRPSAAKRDYWQARPLLTLTTHVDLWFSEFSKKGLAVDPLDFCILLTGNFKDRIFEVGGQPSATKEIAQKENRH